MKAFAACVLVVASCVCLCVENAWAHRVRIYAWTEGNEIVAEAGFGKGRPAKRCPVSLEDVKTGEKLVTVQTNDEGIARLVLPEKAAAQKLALRVVVDAGEGHRGEWALEPTDYLNGQDVESPSAASVPDASPLPYAVTASPQTSTTGLATDGSAALQASMEKIVRQTVDKALEERLGPLRHMLAKALDPTPGIAEIVGGLGWLVGLAGLVLYFRARSRS